MVPDQLFAQHIVDPRPNSASRLIREIDAAIN